MTTTTHLLALDQGTSSSRSIVFGAQGGIVAMAQAEFRQIYPRPGWVEHDPKEILASQLATAREALAKAGLTAADIASIGITNQRETTLVWNRATGEPVYNAIVWQDRRAEPTCASLREQGLEPLARVPNKGPDGERLRGAAKTVAKKRAMSQRALADLDRWIAGGMMQAAE